MILRLNVKEYTIDEWKIVESGTLIPDVVMFVLITTNVIGHKECTEELVLKCKTGKWRFLEECEGCMTKTGDHIFHILE
eukprot:scaffold16981_cov38-Cyclotella_meneghiniana.AAC.1